MLALHAPFEKQLDQLLHDVLGHGQGNGNAWMPRANVYEDTNGFSIRAALPGIDPKEARIVVEDGVLTISGERKVDAQETERTYYAREIGTGSFARSFRLPTNVDTEKVTASYKDGVLAVNLPKKEEAKPRQIVIETK